MKKLRVFSALVAVFIACGSVGAGSQSPCANVHGPDAATCSRTRISVAARAHSLIDLLSGSGFGVPESNRDLHVLCVP